MKECIKCKRMYGDLVERCPRDQSSLQTALPGPITIASRYRIVERIASGSLGVVYRGIDSTTDQGVALKLISPEFALADPQTVEIFFRAAETMKFSHRNIVKVIDYGKSTGNTLYMAMEYLNGVTLAEFIEQEPEISVDRAIFLMSQLCDGLVALHKRGHLYGSLKPANIMVNVDDNNQECVKLLDCGFSYMKTEKLCNSIPSQIAQRLLDIPHYLSPEICDGQESDARSEVYALGAIFFHLLTRQTPFTGPTPFAVMSQHLSAQPPLLRQLRSEIPESLEVLVSRALCKDLSERIQTPAAFATLLKLCKLPSNASLSSTGSSIDLPMSAPAIIAPAPAATAPIEMISLPILPAPEITNPIELGATTPLSANLLQQIVEPPKPTTLSARDMLLRWLELGVKTNATLNQSDIPATDLVQQLAVQFESKNIFKDGVKYVPNQINVLIAQTTPERLEAFELLFQSTQFVAAANNFITELGYQRFGKLQVEIEVIERERATNTTRIVVDWPNEENTTNGLEKIVRLSDQNPGARYINAVIPKVALLQTINAYAHHEQFLIVRPIIFMGRFRNIIDHATGSLARRNDFAFLQSEDQDRINLSISRQHASIEFRDGEFFVSDMGSRNGTTILRKPTVEIPVPPNDPLGIKLEHRDILRLGLALISFEVVEGDRIEELADRLSNQNYRITPPGSTAEAYNTLAAGVIY